VHGGAGDRPLPDSTAFEDALFFARGRLARAWLEFDPLLRAASPTLNPLLERANQRALAWARYRECVLAHRRFDLLAPLCAAATALWAAIDADVDALAARQSVLVECDKLLAGELYLALRPRFPANRGVTLMPVDHRRDEGEGAITATLKEFRRVVRDGDAQTRVVVVPNFDLMVSADQTGQHVDLTTREVLATLYENPGLCLLAFKDPNQLLATVERRVGLLLREAEAEAERLLRQFRSELDGLRQELREKKVVEFADAEKK